MPVHVRYLHGFASGPNSGKGQQLGQALAGSVASYAVVDLEGGDFTHLTLEAMRARAIAACPSGAPLLLIGSSLGGWLAAELAARRALPNLAGLLLIAPAFGFTARWQERLGADGLAAWRREGYRLFFHHGAQRELPLAVAFLDSCAAADPCPGPPGRPCVIVHGREDETVPPRVALDYALAHPEVELHLVRGDHRLGQPQHIALLAHLARALIEQAEQR
ncbi:MAG: YqiA/YcfP family alpha/beta fold hydrolase [Planctomycetota bacterium]|nr:esterase [Planctomycetota bacterium]MCX8040343.1 esterase [Planctomycetota bacterium]MDW8373799.1 YqiA/YcfP family alpha/beta fold hydrolase [Planctomycetota bacterium]